MDQVTPGTWRWIPGYENLYRAVWPDQILSMPRNTTRGGFLKQHPDKGGYMRVTLTKDGVQRGFGVHQLMAWAFLGEAPPGTEVCHDDGRPSHNAPDNLYHGTRSQNVQDALRHGTHAKRSLTHCPSGHEYNEANTLRYRGYRICIPCDRERKREYLKRKRGDADARPLRRPGRAKSPIKPAPAVRQLPRLPPGLPGEWWLPVVGYEGLYEVSDMGRVRSLPHMTRKGIRGGRVLKACPSGPRRYLVVGLSRDGNVKTVTVHTLVALAFFGPRPDGYDVCHLNGNPANNTPENLAYGSRAENIRDVVRHGRHYWASRETCNAGHDFTPDNTIYRYWPDGTFKQRICKICLAGWRQTSRERRRDAKAA